MYWSNGDSSALCLSKAFQQGISFVETMRMHKGQLLYLDDHLNRLYTSLQEFGLLAAWDKQRVALALQHYVLERGVPQGRGRLQTFDHKELQYFVFQVDDYGYNLEELLTTGIHATWSTCVRAVDDVRYRHKTNNYMSPWIEQRRCPEAQEILYINQNGFVTEGSKTNLFFIKNDQIFAPHVSCNLLNGVMRQRVIEVLMAEGFEISEGCYTIEDIVHADSVFVTNALMPVAWVKSIDAHVFGAIPQSLSHVFKTL